jgi:hypothetical protein
MKTLTEDNDLQFYTILHDWPTGIVNFPRFTSTSEWTIAEDMNMQLDKSFAYSSDFPIYTFFSIFPTFSIIHTFS